MRLRPIPVIILLSFIVLIGLFAYQIELAIPAAPPRRYNTYTLLTQTPPKEIGSYDVLGYTVDKEEAEKLLASEEGRKQLSPENGAVEVTEELIDLGRKTFYLETFGNEYLWFFSTWYAKSTDKMPIKQTSNSIVFKIPKAVSRAFNQLELVVNPFDNTTRSSVVKVSNDLIQPTDNSALTVGEIFFRF